MKPILKIKIAVDAAMSVSMLLLMAYGLVGEAAHEWIGMGMFALSVAHHILNHRWIQAVPRGRYTPLRVVQTALAGLIFLCMVGSMISGIVLSRHVFAFLPRHGGYELAQQVHILCAYWGFVCMSLHLGFHWSMMLAMARKHLQPSSMRIWSLRLIGWLWAVYGAFAFRRRGVSLYFHSKKVMSIHQEIYAHLIMYNFSEMITSHVVIAKKQRKYTYKANFSVAVHMCRRFFYERASPPDLETIIARNLIPIRPERHRTRNLTAKVFHGFLYRVA